MPKLTLNANKQVIAKAKRIAQRRGTSVSAMFCQYVDAIDSRFEQVSPPAPITRRLRGLAKVSAQMSDRELFEAAILSKGRR